MSAAVGEDSVGVIGSASSKMSVDVSASQSVSIARRSGSPGPPSSTPKKGLIKGKRRNKRYGDSDIITDISEEDLQRAMLGYKSTASGALQPYMYREDFCACCGTRHMAPHMLDMYSTCKSCHNCLREPIVLRMKFEQKLQEVPLEILFATYGDWHDGTKAIEVTEKCREKVIELKGELDRIAFKAHSDMEEYFGSDPSLGQPKQLRIRYRMHNIFGTVIFSLPANNRFPDWVLLARPKERNLRIIRASYGHPKGLTPQGRMSFEVSELVQGLVDVAGGSYLSITANQAISPIFGDPCPGYPKDLRIEYEIMSTCGEETYDVVRGHLRRRIHIEATPIVAPIILIKSATYGITPLGRHEMLKSIQEQLRQINIVEHKIRERIEVKHRELLLLEKKAELIADRKLFQSVEVNFIDITKKMQQLADKKCYEIFLDKETFDPNAMFGNPNKGIVKMIEVNLECQGHDSERRTDNREITSDAQVRNFITTKNSRLYAVVKDDIYGRGIMQQHLEFRTETSSPYVVINRATYGVLSDVSKCVDVTMELQALATGRVLRVHQDVNLDTIFSKDPALGLRKQLHFKYSTLGFRGNLRVRERDDYLMAGIQIGYPPVPPRDEFQDYQK